MTVSVPRGMSRSRSLRLWVRAPRIRRKPAEAWAFGLLGAIRRSGCNCRLGRRHACRSRLFALCSRRNATISRHWEGTCGRPLRRARAGDKLFRWEFEDETRWPAASTRSFWWAIWVATRRPATCHPAARWCPSPSPPANPGTTARPASARRRPSGTGSRSSTSGLARSPRNTSGRAARSISKARSRPGSTPTRTGRSAKRRRSCSAGSGAS